MKKWICILIGKLTFGKVCLNWCEIEPVKVEKKPIVKKPAKAKKPAKVEKKTSITKEMKKQFVKDRANKMSFKAIGKKHGVAASSVSYHIKKSKDNG